MSGKNTITEKIAEKVETDFRDVDIEYKLIAYNLRKNVAMVTLLKREWFSDVVLQDVFTIINDLKMLLPYDSLMRELKSRAMISKGERLIYEEVVLDLYDNIDITMLNEKNIKHLAKQLLDLYESRRVLIGCGEILSSLNNFDLKSSKHKLNLLSKSAELLDTSNGGYYLDDFGERLEIIERRRNPEEDDNEISIPTGVYRFDKMCGGIMRKEFGVIGGIPGVGKTVGLINFALHAWESGNNVMIVSGEMSKDLLEFRIDSNLTGIESMKFRNGALDDDDIKKWGTTIKKYKSLNSNYLYIKTYPRKFTLDNIERDLCMVQDESGKKIDMLCVDYLNIIDNKGMRGNKEWSSQADIVWDFKGLISDYNLVGWTAGQVKDEAYEKELYELDDFKYARAIGETAPVVIALIQSERDKLEGRMKLQVLKMRNAVLPHKPIILVPNLDFMRLHEVVHNRTLRNMMPDTLKVKIKRVKYAKSV